jgi:hypothetical protein
MDENGKLPRDLKVILFGAAFYTLFSLFDWQQVSAFGQTMGQTEWVGRGVIAGVLALALIAWEVGRDYVLYGRRASPIQAVTSLLLALLLALFSLLAFLRQSLFRHWPAWVGLILSLVIAAAALARAVREGRQLRMPKAIGISFE